MEDVIPVVTFKTNRARVATWLKKHRGGELKERPIKLSIHHSNMGAIVPYIHLSGDEAKSLGLALLTAAERVSLDLEPKPI